jgi:hypothetical protein
MNERIRELAEQAGLVKILEEHAHEYGAGTFENTPYPELEKFAELIVRECMACSTWVGKMNKNAIESIHTAHAINQRIKKHFGVEE